MTIHAGAELKRLPRPFLFYSVLALNLLAIWTIAWFMLSQRLGGYKRYPLDAYYYLDMARNFAATGVPFVRFEQGVPIHFFPGYPIFLALCTLGHTDPGWFWFQCFLIAADSVLLIATIRSLGFSGGVALAGGCLLSANCVFLKWAGLPYAELSAIFWILAAALALRWAADKGGWRLLLAGVFAGFAIVTRPDAGYIVPVLGILLILGRKKDQATSIGIVQVSRAGKPAANVAMFLFPAVAIPVLYFAVKKINSGHALPYVDELVTERESSSPAEVFLNSFNRMFRQINTMHPMMWINFGVILMQWFFIAVWIVNLRGFAGRGVMAASWVILAYLSVHSFWHYDTERFNLPILPVVVFLFAAGLEWMIVRNGTIDDATMMRKILFICVIAICSVLQVTFATATIREHQEALSQESGKPEMLASVASRNPGEAWIEADPQFAYYYRGHVYFDRDEPYFYHRTVTDTGEYFKTHKVQWVISRGTPEQWFAAHRDVSTATMTLKMKASDGLFNLYETQ